MPKDFQSVYDAVIEHSAATDDEKAVKQEALQAALEAYCAAPESVGGRRRRRGPKKSRKARKSKKSKKSQKKN